MVTHYAVLPPMLDDLKHGLILLETTIFWLHQELRRELPDPEWAAHYARESAHLYHSVCHLASTLPE